MANLSHLRFRIAEATRRLRRQDEADRGEGALQTVVITAGLLALALLVVTAITAAVNNRLPGIF